MKKILLFAFLFLSNFIFGQTCGVPNVNLFGTTNITSTSAKPYWTAISGAASYKVQYRIRNVGASYSSSFSTTTNSITLTNLLPSTKYEFIVQTICTNGGSSLFSSSGWFTTLAGTSTCGVPNVNLFGTTNITSTSAKPYWTAISGAISYNVQYRIRNIGASYSTSFNTTTNSITLSNLLPSTKYEFIVQTICSTGSGTFSSSGWFTTLAGSTGCISPTISSTSNITNTSATLNWSSVSGALNYTLQYKKVGTTTWIIINNITTTSYSLVGLTINSEYEFQINTICANGTSQYSSLSNFTTTGGVSGVPQFSHIVVVIGENMMPSSLYGNTTSAPYINNLISNGAYFSQSYALSHPSQPNYLQLFSGSNQGVTDDNKPTSHFTTPNLARELVNGGKTFINYSESIPSVGYDGNSSGLYARKHNAVANWMGTGTNQVSTTLNQPFTSFPSNYNNLPSVSFVIPDLCGDGHDVCPPYNNRTKQYDAWIQTYLDGYKQYCSVPSNNSLLIVTFDEDDFTSVNRILTVFYGAHVVTGTYNQTINHYDILRMLEDANGLTTHAGASATSSSITFCWSSLLRTNINENVLESKTVIYPNPINNDFNIEITDKKDKVIDLEIYSILGEMIITNSFISDDSYFKLTLNKDDLKMSSGIYIIKIRYDNIEHISKIIVN